MDEEKDTWQFDFVKRIDTMQAFIQLADFRAQSFVNSVPVKGIGGQIEKHGILISMEMIKYGFSSIAEILVVDLGKAVTGTIHDHVQVGHNIASRNCVPVGYQEIDLPDEKVDKLVPI